jgi:hypothetical protein
MSLPKRVVVGALVGAVAGAIVRAIAGMAIGVTAKEIVVDYATGSAALGGTDGVVRRVGIVIALSICMPVGMAVSQTIAETMGMYPSDPVMLLGLMAGIVLGAVIGMRVNQVNTQ